MVRTGVVIAVEFWEDRCTESEVKLLSRVRLFATPWAVTYQAPPPMGFSRQEYWSGLPFPSPRELSNPGIEPGSPALEADALTSEPPGKPKKEQLILFYYFSSVISWAAVPLSGPCCLSKIRNAPLQQAPHQRAPNSSTNETSWSSKLASNPHSVSTLGSSSPHGNAPFF